MSDGVYTIDATGGAAGTGPAWLRHRHLLFHLVASDVRSRYRRSYLGIAWAMIWPIAFSLIMASVAIHVFKQPVQVYLLYVLSGIVIWDLVAGSIGGGIASIQQAEGYLKQTRLPYLLFPIRTVTFLSVNTLFSSIACVAMILLLNPSAMSWTWLLWPVIWAMTYAFCVPLCLISAIANLKFRDYQHGISLLIFLFWYLSPNMVVREVYEQPGLREFTALNPFASLLDMFRNVALYAKLPDAHDLTVWASYTVAAWVLALLWLRAEGRKLIYYM
jgi:lipopolysaccharide transport system permease protein